MASGGGGDNNVRVAVRCRPLSGKERRNGEKNIFNVRRTAAMHARRLLWRAHAGMDRGAAQSGGALRSRMAISSSLEAWMPVMA